MKKLFLLFSLNVSLLAWSQSVGINTSTPAPSSAFEVFSTTQGILIPRLTTAQRSAISNPAEGLQIYNRDIRCFEFFDGAQWRSYGCCTPAAVPPSSVTATLVGNTGASIAFAGGNGNSFTVFSNPAGIQVSGTTSPISVTGLQPGASYTFTVVSTTTCGASLPSAPSNSITASNYTPGSTTFNHVANVQTFTVPAGVTSIRIQAVGAKGGDNFANNSFGGTGARMEATFTVTPGEQLSVIVGKMGGKGNFNLVGGGGGGGSFVYRTSSNTLLIAAGGGGGANYTSGAHGQHANTGQQAGSGGYGAPTPGFGGVTDESLGGGGSGSGGGGWLGAGGSNSWSSGGAIAGGPGGAGIGNANGGYGGGGGGYHGGGGGGGYSGGNGGYPGGTGMPAGGGGGSFSSGTSPNHSTGVGTSDGYVTITW